MKETSDEAAPRLAGFRVLAVEASALEEAGLRISQMSVYAKKVSH